MDCLNNNWNLLLTQYQSTYLSTISCHIPNSKPGFVLSPKFVWELLPWRHFSFTTVFHQCYHILPILWAVTFEIPFLCESSGNWNMNNGKTNSPACWCSTVIPFQMQDISWSLCLVYTANLYWTKRGRSKILYKVWILQKCYHLLSEVTPGHLFHI